jgi:CRP-like cAMP-binding protein
MEKIGVLFGMNTDQFQEFNSFLEPVGFKAGELIIKQGDSSDGMYFLISGELTVHRETANGGRVFLRGIDPGGFFGEVGVLTPGNRTATVKAKTACNLLWLSNAKFAALQLKPALANLLLRGVCRSLAMRLTGLSAQYAELSSAVSF